MSSVGNAPLGQAILTRVARTELFEKYRDRIEMNPALSRSLVSYQSNKKRPYYRWFKYKEGFSAALVEYVLSQLGKDVSRVLDPFAGSGAALFASREFGIDATGIELLPVGWNIVRSRLASETVSNENFRNSISRFRDGDWNSAVDQSLAFPHLTITRGAFPEETEKALLCFRTYVRDQIADPQIRDLFHLAGMSVLESVSYTRKDGQYLRWDHRAPRELRGKQFDKGRILSLEEALKHQFAIMLEDLTERSLFSHDQRPRNAEVQLRCGSCLKILPDFDVAHFDLIITSPPYCNRYDYTRTYALELAYLGVGTAELKELRQELLSCTVENRTKIAQLREQYEANGNSKLISEALSAANGQAALQEVLAILERRRADGLLNNTNVPRMVRNYFLESAITVFEFARILRPGGRVVMVNDNVQYAGEEIPVDLILSDIAEQAGFQTEHIWTLGRGKGNSSQQMGEHGRRELRKCAYVWRRM